MTLILRPLLCLAAISAFAQSPLLNTADPFWKKTAPELFSVAVVTTQGKFSIECHRSWAPIGVDRFYNLVRAGFFDDSRFFRVRAGYIAQFGIAGDPAVAAIWRKRTMPDDPVRQSNLQGLLGYAMTGPNQRTTQLYINLRDNVQLDEQGFAPIGKVVGGLDVVNKLYAGYGEDAGGGMREGKQSNMFEGGNAYLDKLFPKLDKLIKASVRGKSDL